MDNKVGTLQKNLKIDQIFKEQLKKIPTSGRYGTGNVWHLNRYLYYPSCPTTSLSSYSNIGHGPFKVICCSTGIASTYCT